ncbi:hypothetical protein CPB86DRAFT_847369 [Serendipita vermifera]|nr:hypothetical protein CPB86DRAFT_847369 [Serendipita vermifera]
MAVGFRTLTEEQKAFVVPNSAPLGFYVALIQSETGLPLDQMRIIWEGMQLIPTEYPTHTLSHYRISDGSVLWVILRLRGGNHEALGRGPTMLAYMQTVGSILVYVATAEKIEEYLMGVPFTR